MKGRLINSIKKVNGCWLWTKSVVKKGYGRITIGSKLDNTRKNAFAHRVSYETFVGEIPDGMLVLHKCDNPSCINPDHLFLGTHKDNADDMVKKGRCPNSSLINLEIARLIKEKLQNGVKQIHIAKLFKIPLHVVKDISRGKTWKNAA